MTVSVHQIMIVQLIRFANKKFVSTHVLPTHLVQELLDVKLKITYLPAYAHLEPKAIHSIVVMKVRF